MSSKLIFVDKINLVRLSSLMFWTEKEYNCAMMACVAGGESIRALDILERVKRSKGGINSGPDMLMYTSAITACATEGETKVYRWHGESLM